MRFFKECAVIQSKGILCTAGFAVVGAATGATTLVIGDAIAQAAKLSSFSSILEAVQFGAAGSALFMGTLGYLIGSYWGCVEIDNTKEKMQELLKFKGCLHFKKPFLSFYGHVMLHMLLQEISAFLAYGLYQNIDPNFALKVADVFAIATIGSVLSLPVYFVIIGLTIGLGFCRGVWNDLDCYNDPRILP